MIYLRIENNQVKAYGYEIDNYNLVITDQEWQNANYSAYLENSKIILGEPQRSYAEKRMIAYPFIEEQLDMIYWDKINGTNNWQEKITEIKEKYPKA